METRLLGTWVVFISILSGLIVPTIASSDLTQMNVSPRIVEVGVETEITVSYREKPYKEGDAWVEGKIIRGYAPTLEGAGVSIISDAIELALEWKVVVKPTEISSINVYGRDETGATHVDTVQVVQELPPPLLEPNSYQTVNPFTYLAAAFLIIFVVVVFFRFRRQKIFSEESRSVAG